MLLQSNIKVREQSFLLLLGQCCFVAKRKKQGALQELHTLSSRVAIPRHTQLVEKRQVGGLLLTGAAPKRDRRSCAIIGYDSNSASSRLFFYHEAVSDF